MVNLLRLSESTPFQLHSGAFTPFKIDCDALTDKDIEAAAFMLAPLLPPFGAVEGVPRGGLRLAAAMERYKTSGRLLIVDDVLTSGRSMESHRDRRDANGAVIFARGPCPIWIQPLFRMAYR